MTSLSVLSDRRPMMGGDTVITLVGGSSEMLEAAFALGCTCERLWSRFEPASDLARLSAAAPQPESVSPLTLALIDEMVEGAHLTEGDFNPTLGGAVVRSGYESSVETGRSASWISSSALGFDDLSGITLSPTSVALPRGMTLDAGGIGKGFAADLIVAAAMQSGARGALVSMSGDVVVSGESPDGQMWRIGVENPFDERAHVTTIGLSEGAVVTSSQRKRRFGTRHHLIDPQTGRSAETTVQAVTVVATSGARAEVLAKSGFLRPVEEYLAWLPTFDASGLVVDGDGTILVSPNWPGPMPTLATAM